MNKLGYSDKDYKKFHDHAWKSLIGFSIMYAFIYNGRMNLPIAQALMMEELNWSSRQIGLVSSSLFWAYGFGHLLNGRLGTIFGIKRFIVTGVLLSCLANVLISFSTNIGLIATLWGLNGYFQSMIWSPGMGLLSNWWPKMKRGFATGVATGAAGISQVIAWLCVGAVFTLFPQMGWRAAFNFPLILTLMGGLFFWLISDQNPQNVGLAPYEEDADTKKKEDAIFNDIKSKNPLYAYKLLFTDWKFILMCFIIAFCSICQYGLITLMPRYYREVLEMDIVKGIFSSVVLPLGMAAGSFITPWISDGIARHKQGSRMPAIIVCSLLSGLTIFLFTVNTSQVIGSILLFFAGFFVYSINGVIWAYSTDIGMRAFASIVAGVLSWASYIGAALQAVVFGFILGDTNNWNMVFITIAFFSMVIMILALIVNKKQITCKL